MTIQLRTACLLFLATLAWGLPVGQTPQISQFEPAYHTPLRTVQDSLLTLLGHDGNPAWNWPDLPAAEVRYRTRIEVPASCQLLAYELAAFGGQADGNDTEDYSILRLLSLDETVIHQADSLLLQAWGGAERVELEVSRSLAAGEYLIELVRPTGQAPPWLAADDDCDSHELSSISVAGVTDGFETVSHDLNLRLLVRYLEDDQPPQVRTPDFDRVSLDAGLDVLLRARDESGLDSAWVELEYPVSRVSGLRLLAALEDTSCTDWRSFAGTMELSGLALEADSLLRGSFFVRDTLQNTKTIPFELTATRAAIFSYAAGFKDEYRFPLYPPVGADAFAFLLDLETLAMDLGMLEAEIAGLSLLTRGIGSTSVYLFADDNGLPVRSAVGDTLLSTTISATVTCPGWQQLDFAITEGDVLLELEQIWLMLVPEAISQGQALFFESIADTSQESSCYVYHPLEGTLSQLEGVQPCLRILAGGQSCNYAGSMNDGLGDTDFTFTCWEISPDEGYPTGWFLSSENGSDSPSFAPSAAASDPDDLQEGSFAVISSDLAGEGDEQQDTLFTPWISMSGTIDVSLLSCYGNLIYQDPAENAMVLLQCPDCASEWTLLFDDFALDSPVEDDPVWYQVQTNRNSGLDDPALQRLAFVYTGSYDYGWAIDDLQINSTPQETIPNVFDGPQVAEAELGRLYPNPFNPVALIPYRVRELGPVRISVHNLLGQEVAVLLNEAWHSSGYYQLSWQPGTMSSGLYLVRLQSLHHQEIKRILYLK